MAKQTTSTAPSGEGSTALVTRTGPANIQAAAFMAGNRETLKAIQKIGEQVLIDQALQAGIEWKALHAQEQETEDGNTHAHICACGPAADKRGEPPSWGSGIRPRGGYPPLAPR